MDIALAKRFIYYQHSCSDERDKIYISTELDKIMSVDEHAADLIGVYGVIDTESGCKLVETTFAYDGHPIMLGTFLHEDYFMKHYENREKIYLD